MKNILVVAPHPDDETLGCGGTLLKHKTSGDKIHWLIVTGINEEAGFNTERIMARNHEIETVSAIYGFESVVNLNLPTAKLDNMPMQQLVEMIGDAIFKIRPEILYVPYPGDIHTDHKVVFQAVAACSKWFRFDSVKRVLAYETISETNFDISPEISAFNPNVFVSINEFILKKLQIMRIYKSEMGLFPFPRSEEAILALAQIRGAAAGCKAAEAFMLLKEIS
ncbi:MAG: PIG-L deacetylase family protein [Syntrophomonadaceae bacterium]|jgi:LmbE family N-acetylglucosaminyl deacetylase